MVDTFPGLQTDAQAMIRKGQALILAARQLMAYAAQGNADAAKDACRDIARGGKEIGSSAEDFQNTTDHFVVYPDYEEG